MTPTVAAPPPDTAASTPLDLGAELILVRLLVPLKQPPAPSKIRADLAKFFASSPTADQVRSWIDRLRTAGYLAERRAELTPTGRERALAFLGTSELPAKFNWQTLQARYLLPRALGFAPGVTGTQRTLSRQEGLAALLLARKFDLQLPGIPSLGAVLQALVCRELGFPDQTTLAEVQTQILNRLVQATEPLRSEQLNKQVPRVLLGTKRSGVAALRDLALARLGSQASSVPESPSAQVSQQRAVNEETEVATEADEFDLGVFAQTVLAIARDCPDGRFGDNKVFINHLWRYLATEPTFAGMDYPTFQRRLLEAHQADLLTLTRADLVSVMPPEDVRESEIQYLNATFHLLVLPRVQT
jgi:hypothetical protein